MDRRDVSIECPKFVRVASEARPGGEARRGRRLLSCDRGATKPPGRDRSELRTNGGVRASRRPLNEPSMVRSSDAERAELKALFGARVTAFNHAARAKCPMAPVGTLDTHTPRRTRRGAASLTDCTPCSSTGRSGARTFSRGTRRWCSDRRGGLRRPRSRRRPYSCRRERMSSRRGGRRTATCRSGSRSTPDLLGNRSSARTRRRRPSRPHRHSRPRIAVRLARRRSSSHLPRSAFACFRIRRRFARRRRPAPAHRRARRRAPSSRTRRRRLPVARSPRTTHSEPARGHRRRRGRRAKPVEFEGHASSVEITSESPRQKGRRRLAARLTRASAPVTHSLLDLFACASLGARRANVRTPAAREPPPSTSRSKSSLASGSSRRRNLRK